MAVTSEGLEKFEDMVVRAAETTAAHARAARAVIATVIFGQEQVIDRALITILSGGHALLVGVPGLAKTKLVETMGTALGLDARRIQFTPDLMPSDILGTEVLEETPGGKRSFRFISGPVFAQLLMADEINRASPRTQSALLQAMQEHHVTVAGARHDLPAPFHVLATQNPLEQEGTYPLPEAQLDRFLIRLDIGYPSEQQEQEILRRRRDARADAVVLPQLLSAQELLAMQALLEDVFVEPSVDRYIVTLVRATRDEPRVAMGGSPRASLALMKLSRALAALDGRSFVTPDDVKAAALSVLPHRLVLRPEHWGGCLLYTSDAADE